MVVFFVVGVFCTLSMIRSYAESILIEKRLIDERKLHVKNLEIHLHYYHTLNKLVEDFRIERHDMKHYLGTINMLIKGQNYDEIEEITNEYGKRIDDLTLQRYSNNDVLNANISYYFSRANEEGIPVEHEILVSSKLSIFPGDLTNVLGNILENALNASAIEVKDRFINFKIKSRKNNLIITCENAYNDAFGKHGDGHGLDSIKRICEKYKGYMNIKRENSIFTIRVILPIGERK
ncbi:MAG: sensor histidine kinase [Clostridium sp.]